MVVGSPATASAPVVPLGPGVLRVGAFFFLQMLRQPAIASGQRRTAHAGRWEDDLQEAPDLTVPGERIELPTNGLQNRCSTAELTRQINGLGLPNSAIATGLPPEKVATRSYSVRIPANAASMISAARAFREQVAVHPKRNRRGSVTKPAADGQDMLMWNISPSAADSLFNWSNVILIVGAAAVLLGTIGSIKFAAIREYFADLRISENERATTEAIAESDKAKAESAKATLALSKAKGRQILNAKRPKRLGPGNGSV